MLIFTLLDPSFENVVREYRKAKGRVAGTRPLETDAQTTQTGSFLSRSGLSPEEEDLRTMIIGFIEVQSEVNPFDWKWRVDTFLTINGSIGDLLNNFVRDKADFTGVNITEKEELWERSFGEDSPSAFAQRVSFALDFSSSSNFWVGERGALQKREFLKRYHTILLDFRETRIHTEWMPLKQVQEHTGNALEDLRKIIPEIRSLRIEGRKVDALLSAITLNPFSTQLWRVYLQYYTLDGSYRRNKSLFEKEGYYREGSSFDRKVSLKVALNATDSAGAFERVLRADGMKSLGSAARSSVGIKSFSFHEKEVRNIIRTLTKLYTPDGSHRTTGVSAKTASGERLNLSQTEADDIRENYNLLIFTAKECFFENVVNEYRKARDSAEDTQVLETDRPKLPARNSRVTRKHLFGGKLFQSIQSLYKKTRRILQRIPEKIRGRRQTVRNSKLKKSFGQRQTVRTSKKRKA